MRIQRHSSIYRHRRRQSGCLPFTLLFGLLIAGLLLSWGWISQRIFPPPPTANTRDLSGARQAFDKGDLETAIENARTVYNADSTRIDALMLLVRALIYHSYSDYNTGINRELALQLTTAALAQFPHNPDVLAIHGFALQANGRSMDAYRTVEKALILDPNNILARIVLGMAYGGVGAFDNALREHETTTQMDVSDWKLELLRGLAIAYSDLARYEEAGATIALAITLNKKLPVLHFERALYALQLGDASEATEAYFDIMAYQPDNVKVRLRMCELSSTMRERENALDFCTQVTTLAPTWADGWHKLGREYFLQGDFVSAQDALNRCSSLQVMQNIPISERRFECWYLQGQAAEINGDCPALIATYNEFRAMAATSAIQQTWVYPPEGPPGCVGEN